LLLERFSLPFVITSEYRAPARPAGVAEPVARVLASPSALWPPRATSAAGPPRIDPDEWTR
jgi:hypothetical protein